MFYPWLTWPVLHVHRLGLPQRRLRRAGLSVGRREGARPSFGRPGRPGSFRTTLEGAEKDLFRLAEMTFFDRKSFNQIINTAKHL